MTQRAALISSSFPGPVTTPHGLTSDGTALAIIGSEQSDGRQWNLTIVGVVRTSLPPPQLYSACDTRTRAAGGGCHAPQPSPEPARRGRPSPGDSQLVRAVTPFGHGDPLPSSAQECLDNGLHQTVTVAHRGAGRRGHG